jgi:hypothetical protein
MKTKLEYAYRIPGSGWRRKTMTAAAFERFLDGLIERFGDCIEIRVGEVVS